jgi:hypothetical protein
VSDHDTSALGSRLSDLADELAPSIDVIGHVEGARLRYRRNRRVRMAVVAAAAAVAVAAVGIPAAVGSLAGPSSGEVAGTSPQTPALTGPARDRDDVTVDNALADQRPDATTRAAMHGAAQLAAALGNRSERLELTAPADFADCPDGARTLGEWLKIDLPVQQGSLPGGPDGCEWMTAGALPEDRLTMGIGFLVGTTAEQMQRGVTSSQAEGCYVEAMPNVAPPLGALQVCSRDGTVDWYLNVMDTSGAGVWVLHATVGENYGPDNGVIAIMSVAELAEATW